MMRRGRLLVIVTTAWIIRVVYYDGVLKINLSTQFSCVYAYFRNYRPQIDTAISQADAESQPNSGTVCKQRLGYCRFWCPCICKRSLVHCWYSDEPLSSGNCTIKLSLSALGIGVGRSGETAAAAGGGGLRASGGEGAFCCGPWPSMPEPANSANRKARATSDTLSERLVAAWFATRSRPEWNDGDFGIPSGETARRGLLSAAANIAREGARAAGPAWTIAGGGRQRHPSGGPAAPGPVRAAVRGRTATRRFLPRVATCGAAGARALPPHPAARPRRSHPSRSIQPPVGLLRHTMHDLHNV